MSARARKVLVYVDGSDSSERALDEAVALVGYGSTLAVAGVASNDPNGVLDDTRERLVERHVPASYVPLRGDPLQSLVDVARAFEADVLVLGARRENHGPAGFLWPVDVVREAPCHVLVVK